MNLWLTDQEHEDVFHPELPSVIHTKTSASGKVSRVQPSNTNKLHNLVPTEARVGVCVYFSLLEPP